MANAFSKTMKTLKARYSTHSKIWKAEEKLARKTEKDIVSELTAVVSAALAEIGVEADKKDLTQPYGVDEEISGMKLRYDLRMIIRNNTAAKVQKSKLASKLENTILKIMEAGDDGSVKDLEISVDVRPGERKTITVDVIYAIG